jgi:hypothetical protein
METIIQAGNKRLKIASVPIDTNAKTRESRLFSSIGSTCEVGEAIRPQLHHVQAVHLLRWLGIVLFVVGLIPFVRYAILIGIELQAALTCSR